MNSLPSSPGWEHPRFARKSTENSNKPSGPAVSLDPGDDRSSISSASGYNRCISCNETESTIKFVRCVECKRPWHIPCWPSGTSPICLREKCKIRAEKRKARAEASAVQQRTGFSDPTALPSKMAELSSLNLPRLPKSPSCEVLNCQNAPLLERIEGMVLCKFHSMSKRHEQASKLANSTRTEVVRKPINAAKVHPALRPEDRQLLNKVKRTPLTRRTSISGSTGQSNHAQKRGESMASMQNFHKSKPQHSSLQREEGFGGANAQLPRSLHSTIKTSSAQRNSVVHKNHGETSASVVSFPDIDIMISKDTTNDRISGSPDYEPPLANPVDNLMNAWEPPRRAESPGAQIAREMSASFNPTTLPTSISASKTYQAPYVSSVEAGSDSTPPSVGAETGSRLESSFGVGTETIPASTASRISDHRSYDAVPTHDPKDLTSKRTQEFANEINNLDGMTSSPKRRKITADHDRDTLMVNIGNDYQESTLLQRSLAAPDPALSAAPTAAAASGNSPSMNRGAPKLTAPLTTSASTKGTDVNRSTPKLSAPPATSRLESPIKFHPPTNTHPSPSTLPLEIPNTSSPSRSPSPERIANSLTGLVLGSEDYTYPPDHPESLRRARQASLDENKMDRIISQYQPNEDPDYEPTDRELASSQNWGHINPRNTWPPPKPSPDWFAAKRADILARNKTISKSARRKKNFGVLLTEETKAQRRAKGWNIHQEREVEATAGRRECARRLEAWTVLKVGDFEPSVVNGKLVTREKEGTRTADGTRVKVRDELRVLAAE